MSESLGSNTLYTAFEGFSGFSPESTAEVVASGAALKAEDGQDQVLASVPSSHLGDGVIVVPNPLSAVRINGLLDGLSGAQRTALILNAVDDK